MREIKPVTTATIRRMKREKTPIAVVTAYDYPSAKLADTAGADVILVGDSLGNVVLGLDSTIPVTLDQMIYHTQAVTRAAKRSHVVTDMPFLTYHGSLDRTLAHAGRIMQEGLAKSVKMEGGAEIAETVQACVRAGIPVMGHLGFTPQAVHQMGGYFVQGRTEDKADRMIEDALALEQAGVYAIVLELVPEPLAKRISEKLSVPTIGIGAGRFCDGQVLVYHDLLQYGDIHPKRFVKSYVNIGEQINQAIQSYVDDVKQRKFPAQEHVFDAEEALETYQNKPINGT